MVSMETQNFINVLRQTVSDEEENTEIYRQTIENAVFEVLPRYKNSPQAKVKILEEKFQYGRRSSHEKTVVIMGRYEISAMNLSNYEMTARITIEVQSSGKHLTWINVIRDQPRRDLSWHYGRPNMVRCNPDGTIKRGPPTSSDFKPRSPPRKPLFETTYDSEWYMDIDRYEREKRRGSSNQTVRSSSNQTPSQVTSSLPQSSVPPEDAFQHFLKKFEETIKETNKQQNLSADEIEKQARAIYKHFGNLHSAATSVN